MLYKITYRSLGTHGEDQVLIKYFTPEKLKFIAKCTATSSSSKGSTVAEYLAGNKCIESVEVVEEENVPLKEREGLWIINGVVSNRSWTSNSSGTSEDNEYTSQVTKRRKKYANS